MRVPPPNLDPAHLAEALARGWGFAAASLVYQPVGFGSHHWLATDSAGNRRFVTVDVLTGAGGTRNLDAERGAFETAYALRHRAGLDFVVAPLPAVDGQVVGLLEPGFAITVFELLDGTAWPEPAEATTSDEQQVAGLLARSHAATDLVAEVAAVDDLAIEQRAHLERRLQHPDLSWSDGPYAARARALLLEHRDAVCAGLGAYDALAVRAREQRASWVITHGEPHSANLLRTSSGPVLLDWDTALVAPAGRDVWMLAPAGRAHYAELVGHAVPPPDLEFYRLRWDLTEVALYVRWFADPHEVSEDSEIAWGGFVEAIENVVSSGFWSSISGD